MKIYYPVTLLLLSLPFSLQEFFIPPTDKSPCSNNYGCHNGYCWAGCSVFGTVDGAEWCYTSNGNGYVKCESDSDCNRCWSCGGGCTV